MITVRIARGKRIRVDTMLTGMLLPSGNDAAIALAQRAAGTVPTLRRRDERPRPARWACAARASPRRTASRTAATARAPPTWRRIARAGCCGVPRLARIVPQPGGGLCRSRSRAASSTWPTPTRCCARATRGLTGMKTGYTDAVGTLLRRHGAARWWSSSAWRCCTRPTRPARLAGLLDRGFAVGRR